MRERRLIPVGRAATAGVPRLTLGGPWLAGLDLEQTGNFTTDMVFPQRRLPALYLLFNKSKPSATDRTRD